MTARLGGTTIVCLVRDQIVLVFVGFALTTVAGGLLGYWLQSRAWRRQERDRQTQAQLDAATAFYEALSRLLDRRLHRMRQLDGRLERPGQAEDVERLLLRYREVLDEWNDNLNRNLALAVRYFGADAHATLQGLYERFAAAGARIEARVREYRQAGEASSTCALDELNRLDLTIYDLNVALITALQSGAVGVHDGRAGSGLQPDQILRR